MSQDHKTSLVRERTRIERKLSIINKPLPIEVQSKAWQDEMKSLADVDVDGESLVLKLINLLLVHYILNIYTSN